jgi:hypothetical protein
MGTSLFAAVIISITGVLGFLVGAIVLGVYSILIPLACYLLIYLRFREHFWKSFAVGVVIGFPISIYLGANLLMMYYSSPEYQEWARGVIQSGDRALMIIDSSFCYDDHILMMVSNPSKEAIMADEIEIEYIEGSCDSYEIKADRFEPDIMESETIDFNGCSEGTVLIRVISPEGMAEKTFDCKREPTS